jgi:TetR/AcrR family transcriptional repressor of nem operon
MVALSTKMRLLDVGTEMLLERGYNDTGLQDLLVAASVPKGSFYHHFKSKEAFALEIVDRYGVETLAFLDETLDDTTYSPLQRVRRFFSAAFDQFTAQGCRHGCLMGNLGQELADANEHFRHAIQEHLEGWAARLAETLAEAVECGELPPGTDPVLLGRLLIDGFQGAALRMKLERDRAPLDRFLAHYFPVEKAA